MGLPTLGSVRAHFFGLFVCTAGFLFGYDTGIVGGVLVLKSFQNDFGINDDNKTKISSLIVALQQAGAFVSALGCAPIADWLGRKKSIMLAMTIFVIGVVLELVPSHSLALFYVGRVVCGLGLGSATAIVPSYNAEMAPKEIRGRVGSGMQWLFVWGVLLSYWVDYGVKVGMSDNSSRQWQVPVGLQAVPAGILGFGLLTQPESVRWLVKKDQIEKGWKSLTWMRASDSADVKAEFDEIQMGVHEEVAASQGLKKRELLEPANRLRLGLAFGVFLGQQCTGATALAYFGPQFFTLLAGGDATQALLITGLFGVIKVISTGTFLIFFSDRLGRKPVMFYSAIFMAVCMVIVATVNATEPPPKTGGATSAGIATVAMIFLTIFIYCFSWGPLPWVYTSEIFPSRIREIGVSTGVGTQWLFNFMFSLVTPYMIKNMKWGTFLFYAILDLCIAVFVWTCLKETCGKSIEEMEEIFNSQAGKRHRSIGPIEGVEEEDGLQKPSTEFAEDLKR